MKDKTAKENNSAQEKAEQALKFFDTAFRSGMKFQEQASLWWTDLMQETLSSQDWRKPYMEVSQAMNEVLPSAQKRMEEALDLAQTNAKTGVELLNKVVDAAQTPGFSESQSKWMDFWTSAITAAQNSTGALMQFNARTMDTWIGFMQKNARIPNWRETKAI